MLNINHLPAWIRHTDYCPFKALDIDTSDMTIPEYFEVMSYLAILSPELRHAINRALRFAKREALARKKFKAVFEAAPAAIKFGFDRKTYQNPESEKPSFITQDLQRSTSKSQRGSQIARPKPLYRARGTQNAGSASLS